MKKISILLAFVFALALTSTVNAQDSRNFDDFGVHSVGITVGYYSPAFDYWKDRTGYDFSGGLMTQAKLDVNLFNPIRARIGVGYFTTNSSVTNYPEWGEEKMTISMIPISFDGLAYLYMDAIDLYAGLGFDWMMINKKYESPDGSQTSKGNNTIGHVILGAEKTFGAFGAGLEFQYMFGKYTQDFGTKELVVTEEDISLNGPFIGVNLKYVLWK